MEYYNDVAGRYETLVLDEFDLIVKENVVKIYAKNFHDVENEIELYNKVEQYYSEEVGIMNHRLQTVIEYYSNEIFGVQ